MSGGFSRARLVPLVVALAAAAVLTTASLAGAHGGDGTLIHACVVSGSGNIRIVEANSECRNGETPLDWVRDGLGDLEAIEAALLARIEAVESRTSDLEASASALDVRATELETTVADLVTGVAGLEIDVAEFATRADELDADVAALDVRATELEADITAIETRTTDLEASVVVLNARAGDLEDSLAALAVRVTALEADATATAARVTSLGSVPGAGDTDRVHASRLTGRTSATVFFDPPAIPAATRSALTIPVMGLEDGDMVVVSPPAAVHDDLLFVGSDVDPLGGAVIVYLYNATAEAIDDGPANWGVEYLDFTP